MAAVVAALPATPAVTRVSAATVCQNTNVVFRVTAPVAGATYTWGGTAGTASGTGNGTLTVSGAAAGNKSVTVYATAPSSGVNCVSATSGAVAAVVAALPATPAVTLVSAATVCQNTNVVFRVTAPVAGATYTWGGTAGTASGTGNGTLTVSGAAAGNKSVTVYATAPSSGVNCVSATSGAVASVVAALPATPAVTRVSAATVCQNTNVVFRVTAPVTGATYTWGGTAGTASGTGNGTLTVSGTAGNKSVTVYATAPSSGVNCVSATSAAMAAVVAAPPTITRSGGALVQSVNRGAPITTITYTASNATSISLSSGSFPTGMKGAASGLVYTISGTPSATGTFGFTVTTANGNGCTNATVSGTITVVAYSNSTGGPTTAYSTGVIVFGSQSWTDHIVATPAGCANTDILYSSSLPPAQYRVSNGRYYYNWTCIDSYPTQLCPSPWRVPTSSDVNTLISNTDATTLLGLWGTGGIAIGNTIDNVGQNAYYGVSTELDSDNAYLLRYFSGTLDLDYTQKYRAPQVRCVK
jgi:hypothetical protein